MLAAAQRQRKLAVKSARRKVVVAGKKAQEAVANSLPNRVREAATGDFVECRVASTLFELGIGQLTVVRRLPSGLFGCAFFLLDVFCLGVKDVYFDQLARSELKLRTTLHEAVEDMIDIEPAYGRKLIRDAAAYAAALDLPAPKALPVIATIFGDVDPGTCSETFTFGKDGKPLFVCGPNDTPAMIRDVCQTLERTQGIGGFDYILEVLDDW